MSKRAAIILVNYKDYAKRYLPECVESLRKQDYQEFSLFIVDNETSDESFNYIKETAPEAEIIRNEKNDGFAKGNNDAIKIALERGFEYIILFNMDTVIDEKAVGEMIRVAEEDLTQPSPYKGEGKTQPLTPQIPPTPFVKGGEMQPPAPPLLGGQVGAVQARLMLYPEKEKVNSSGNVTHFLGFGYSEGYNEVYSSLRAQVKQSRDRHVVACAPPRDDEEKSPLPPLLKGAGAKEICYPSGAAVLFKAEVLKKVGLFDEELWMYNEDQDLGWRTWLAGYRCVLADKAVVYHKYEFSRSITKYYWMDRNRIIVMLKNYHWLTLVLNLPAFMAMEFGLFLFAIKGGWLKEKLKVYKYFLNKDNWSNIFKERRKIQALRKTKDSDIIKLFSGKIWYQEIGDWKLKLVNPIFDIYWLIIKFIVIW